MSRWPDLAAHNSEVSPVESTAFTYAPIEKYWNQNRSKEIPDTLFFACTLGRSL